jgi:translation initiation factor 3 subunit M
LNNTYNYLPSNSPLRPIALLALLSVLAISSDLEALPLSSSFLTTALSQWAISSSEKIDFLVQASDIYQSATPSLVAKSLELHLAALDLEVTEKVAEKAVALTLASENRYDLGDVLKTPGVSSKINGKAAELVRLFTEADELEAVSQGQKWAQDNSSFISSFGESCSSDSDCV